MTDRNGATACRQQDDGFWQLVHHIRAVFWLSDAEATRTLYISPAYETIWGRSCESLIERPRSWLEAIHPDDRPRAEAAARAAHAGQSSHVEYRILRPDGGMRWISDESFPICDETGRVHQVAGLAEDITERKQVERALRESEERHRLISELTTDYTYTGRVGSDHQLRLEAASPGFTRVTGYTIEELEQVGGWQKLIHPDDLPRAQKQFAKLAAGKRGVDEIRIRTKGGATRWIRFSTSPVADGGPEGGMRLLGAVQDITERREADAQLREYAQGLQALSRRLLDVQEQERRNLARELHDEIGQLLTGLKFSLEAVGPSAASETTASLAEAQVIVKELTHRIRDLSLRLRPTMLDDLGLLPALLWLFDSYTSRTRICVAFEHQGLGRRLSQSVETAAYRITQEALTNVARHARVQEVAVRAWLAEEQLHLQIEDHGVGFRTEAGQTAYSSAGLSGMQERAALLGGDLMVESFPGQGTKLTAILPAVPRTKEGCCDLDSGAG
jgi:PAS domain S-box-containing protein